MKYLWDELGLNENCTINEVNNTYYNLLKKTKKQRLAWKVLRDPYYSRVYKKYKNIDIVKRAGFFEDKLEDYEINYKLNLHTTPLNKVKEHLKINSHEPVVLLSTGAFNPLHEGHIHMLEIAKQELISRGLNVVGGFLSVCHDDYVQNKTNNSDSAFKRVYDSQIKVENSEWIAIDTYESLYMPTTINFTENIERLKRYIKRWLNIDVQIAYVCGGDNAEFAYCFDNELFVCIDREILHEQFQVVKKLFKCENILFLDNNESTFHHSSSKIRNKTPCEGDYLIRNEGDLPFMYLEKTYSKSTIINAQKIFIRELKEIIHSVLPNINIRIINLSEQKVLTNKKYSSCQTISLDSYYQGDYNIRASRIFALSDCQVSSMFYHGWDTSIKNQIQKIPKGKYVLIDDDCITGNTIKRILNEFPLNVNIKDIYMMNTPYLRGNLVDIVDCRDFLLGADNGGLAVFIDNENIVRFPYTMPYISLYDRASIPLKKQKEFSIQIWKINQKFFESIDKNIKLKDLNENTKKIMNYVGFRNEDKVVEICKWHIRQLQ